MNNQRSITASFRHAISRRIRALVVGIKRLAGNAGSELHHTHPQYERNLMLISGLIVCGILLLGVKTYQNNLRNLDTYKQVDHTRQVLYDAEQISAAVKDLELGVRGYVITGDYTFLGPFYSTRQTIFTRIANLKSLTTDNAPQQIRLDSLMQHLQAKLGFLESCIDIRKKQGTLAAEQYINQHPELNRIFYLDYTLNEIKSEENKNLAIRKEINANSNEAFSRINLVLVIVLMFLVSGTFLALWQNTRMSREAKRSLENSQQLLQAIIDNTSSLIYVKDIYGRFTLVNQQFCKTYDLPAVAVIGKTIEDIEPNERSRMQTHFDDQVIEERKLIEVEEDLNIHGELLHYYSIKFPLIDRNGNLYALAAISTDITDFIRKQNLQRQREIIEHKIEAQELERKEIGIELHDNISQLLASAKMMLDTALYNVQQKDARLEKARNDVYSAIYETRKLSHALVSPALIRQDIATAIRNLAESLRLSGKIKLDLKFNGQKQLESLDEKLKLHLFRITQEQVNNIIKYSRASKVLILLEANEHSIHLQIADNGVGFEPGQHTTGIGLQNIGGRVKLYAGSMTIKAAPMQGCQLDITIPLSQQDALPAA